jgi:hypothetical protein
MVYKCPGTGRVFAKRGPYSTPKVLTYRQPIFDSIPVSRWLGSSPHSAKVSLKQSVFRLVNAAATPGKKECRRCSETQSGTAVAKCRNVRILACKLPIVEAGLHPGKRGLTATTALEVQPEHELHLSRRSCSDRAGVCRRKDLSEAACGQVGERSCKDRVVEDVEDLGAELQSEPFS